MFIKSAYIYGVIIAVIICIIITIAWFSIFARKKIQVAAPLAAASVNTSPTFDKSKVVFFKDNVALDQEIVVNSSALSAFPKCDSVWIPSNHEINLFKTISDRQFMSLVANPRYFANPTDAGMLVPLSSTPIDQSMPLFYHVTFREPAAATPSSAEQPTTTPQVALASAT